LRKNGSKYLKQTRKTHAKRISVRFEKNIQAKAADPKPDLHIIRIASFCLKCSVAPDYIAPKVVGLGEYMDR
jgi:hypothetical protein